MRPDIKSLLVGARSFVKTAAPTVKTAADTGVLQQLLDGGRSLVSKVDLKNPVHTGAIGAGVGALGGFLGDCLDGGFFDHLEAGLHATETHDAWAGNLEAANLAVWFEEWTHRELVVLGEPALDWDS